MFRLSRQIFCVCNVCQKMKFQFPKFGDLHRWNGLEIEGHITSRTPSMSRGPWSLESLFKSLSSSSSIDKEPSSQATEEGIKTTPRARSNSETEFPPSALGIRITANLAAENHFPGSILSCRVSINNLNTSTVSASNGDSGDGIHTEGTKEIGIGWACITVWGAMSWDPAVIKYEPGPPLELPIKFMHDPRFNFHPEKLPTTLLPVIDPQLSIGRSHRVTTTNSDLWRSTIRNDLFNTDLFFVWVHIYRPFIHQRMWVSIFLSILDWSQQSISNVHYLTTCHLPSRVLVSVINTIWV